MIFVIIFILVYLLIATLVYGALYGVPTRLDNDYTNRPRPFLNELRIAAAVLGLFWPIVICIEDARKDVFSKHPLKF